MYISGLFSPLRGYRKAKIGYAGLYFQQSVLPFMFIRCNSKPNIAKMIVLQVTYYVEIISRCILLDICLLVTLADFREVCIFYVSRSCVMSVSETVGNVLNISSTISRL
jgi:hypothetical protein